MYNYNNNQEHSLRVAMGVHLGFRSGYAGGPDQAVQGMRSHCGDKNPAEGSIDGSSVGFLLYKQRRMLE